MDLRDIVNSKEHGLPTNIRYKGNKIVSKETMDTKKVYGFQVPTKDQKKDRKGTINT